MVECLFKKNRILRELVWVLLSDFIVLDFFRKEKWDVIDFILQSQIFQCLIGNDIVVFFIVWFEEYVDVDCSLGGKYIKIDNYIILMIILQMNLILRLRLISV